jgi:serine/threonine-protein kinase
VTLLDLPGLNATKDHSVPQGLAVDQYRKKLYVGDPDLGRLVAYDLSAGSDDGTLTVGAQQTVASGVDARWVTVDGLGNVYFSDEAKNRIMKVSAEAIDSGKVSTAEVLYEGKDTAFVSAPGGIVADNFFVYWVNKIGGAQAGSLIRGLGNRNTMIGNGQKPKVAALSSNVEKSYGVCLARGKVFYTDTAKNLYVSGRSGGPPEMATTSLSEPRGCAFDGDGTVYVADKGGNAVYSLPANANAYGLDTPLSLVASVQGAFGLAVYTQVVDEPSSWWPWSGPSWWPW